MVSSQINGTWFSAKWPFNNGQFVNGQLKTAKLKSNKSKVALCESEQIVKYLKKKACFSDIISAFVESF